MIFDELLNNTVIEENMIITYEKLKIIQNKFKITK